MDLSILPPEEMVLTRKEAAALWREIAGDELPPGLFEATAGWHELIRLAASARAAGGSLRVPPLLEPWLRPDRERAPELSRGLEIGVEVLGSPRVEVADGSRPRWAVRRALKILAYLATSPGLEASREALVEAVWPQASAERIARNFHPTLSHLRRGLTGARRASEARRLPKPLLLRGGVYRLNPEVAWRIDSARFEKLLEEGRELREAGRLGTAADRWRKAWSLYRGPLLEGYDELWAGERRERFERLHRELLRLLGDACVDLDHREEAMDAYRALLALDPLQEEVHLAVMRIYAGQGRRDLVRRQFFRLTQLLAEELGVAPRPATASAYHRLMA